MNEEKLLETEEEKPESKGQQFDPEVLSAMLNTGENQAGMVTVEKKPKEGQKEEPLFTEVKEENKVKPGKLKKKLGKYVEKMLFDMKKNPDKYMIETPRGVMSIQDALQQGYDPATKDFTDKGMKEEFDESLNALSESGRERIKQITSRENVQMPESAAEGMGFDLEDPMVAGQAPLPQALPGEGAAPQEGQVSPEMLAALGGGQ